MKNDQIITIILFSIWLSSCGGGTKTYVDYSKAASQPYWTGSPFEKAYAQFQNENYTKAKDLFAELMDSDSLAKDYEGYAFLAECYNRLGQTHRGELVYTDALKSLEALKNRKHEHERFRIILEKVKRWSVNYPNFPKELLEESGFVPYNVPPEPTGGWEAIAKNLKYPAVAQMKGVEGEVQVKTLVDEKGEATQFEIVKSLHPDCDEEAIAALKKVRFRPAKLKGKAAKTWVVLPVQFRLR